MVLNPCKKNQDKAIKYVCEKIGGEYYGPSGKSILQRKNSNLYSAFLEYDKSSEGLKEIDLSSRSLYQTLVHVEYCNDDNLSIKYPIKILINVNISQPTMFAGGQYSAGGRNCVSYDGELKIESIMEAVRIFKSDIIGALYDEALEDLDFKDHLFEKARSAGEIQ